MSHRTRHLPEVTGVYRIIRDMRYHEASRQWLAILLIVLFAVLGTPFEPMTYWFGASLVVIGSLIRLWASGHVKKNKVLATDGPYAYVRHPLYVGNILLLFGYAFASGLWWSFPLLLFFLYFYYPTAIDYEDYKLNNIFGEQWKAWRQKTKALIPTFGRAGGNGKSDWSFKQSLMQNGEPVILVLLFYALYHLWGEL